MSDIHIISKRDLPEMLKPFSDHDRIVVRTGIPIKKVIGTISPQNQLPKKGFQIGDEVEVDLYDDEDMGMDFYIHKVMRRNESSALTTIQIDVTQ